MFKYKNLSSNKSQQSEGHKLDSEEPAHEAAPTGRGQLRPNIPRTACMSFRSSTIEAPVPTIHFKDDFGDILTRTTRNEDITAFGRLELLPCVDPCEHAQRECPAGICCLYVHGCVAHMETFPQLSCKSAHVNFALHRPKNTSISQGSMSARHHLGLKGEQDCPYLAVASPPSPPRFAPTPLGRASSPAHGRLESARVYMLLLPPWAETCVLPLQKSLPKPPKFGAVNSGSRPRAAILPQPIGSRFPVTRPTATSGLACAPFQGLQKPVIDSPA